MIQFDSPCVIVGDVSACAKIDIGTVKGMVLENWRMLGVTTRISGTIRTRVVASSWDMEMYGRGIDHQKVATLCAALTEAIVNDDTLPFTVHVPYIGQIKGKAKVRSVCGPLNPEVIQEWSADISAVGPVTIETTQ